MGKKILLLGHTGKLGGALRSALADRWEVIGRNSRDGDASEATALAAMVDAVAPDWILNTIAFMGLDACERDPHRAFRVNALLPRELALLAARKGIGLIHFSTEAVFADSPGPPWTEEDCPRPLNMYGITKLGGERLVATLAPQAIIIRLPLLFGPGGRGGQFVEKMAARLARGESLRIADDIVTSPSYTPDLAAAVKLMLEGTTAPGLYHLANAGEASLHELVVALAAGLGFDTTRIDRARNSDFPGVGRKMLHTPMASNRWPLLRPWRQALLDYCRLLKEMPPCATPIS
ncbi:MAG: NAD(P)-dependent oxidoreductase [Magnetococcales bacterium]|nr:NAD(P)-dependent oxidoreductase [Magnetococcales bacterium]MBF0157036.1 NAD(P)-dependent oxidoreductase [Magnetococcales bacterium]